ARVDDLVARERLCAGAGFAEREGAVRAIAQIGVEGVCAIAGQGENAVAADSRVPASDLVVLDAAQSICLVEPRQTLLRAIQVKPGIARGTREGQDIV